jgi:hypothetical protein
MILHFLLDKKKNCAYVTISLYVVSFPFESRHRRNETDASTFAGEYVFGSFNSDIILSSIVLKANKRLCKMEIQMEVPRVIPLHELRVLTQSHVNRSANS